MVDVIILLIDGYWFGLCLGKRMTVMEMGSFHDGLCVPTSAWACRVGGVMRSMRKMFPPERLWMSRSGGSCLVCLGQTSAVSGGFVAAGSFPCAALGPVT